MDFRYLWNPTQDPSIIVTFECCGRVWRENMKKMSYHRFIICYLTECILSDTINYYNHNQEWNSHLTILTNNAHINYCGTISKLGKIQEMMEASSLDLWPTVLGNLDLSYLSELLIMIRGWFVEQNFMLSSSFRSDQIKKYDSDQT